MICPCGSKQNYDACCGKFIEHETQAETPEQLMRSRYSAYTQAKIDYIATTMCEQAAIGFNPDEAVTWAKQAKWFGLTVIKSFMKNVDEGCVEFIARFGMDHKIHSIHEISDFKKIDGRWFYIDGQQIAEKPIKIGSNEPCPCGSNKKYKKCCG